MTLSLYLGRGQLSRGRTTIQKGLNMVVSTLPYGNVDDLAAVATAIDHMVAALTPVPGLTYLLPPAGTTGAEYLASVRPLSSLPQTYQLTSLDSFNLRQHRCAKSQPLARHLQARNRQRRDRWNVRRGSQHQDLRHRQYVRC